MAISSPLIYSPLSTKISTYLACEKPIDAMSIEKINVIGRTGFDFIFRRNKDKKRSL